MDRVFRIFLLLLLFLPGHLLALRSTEGGEAANLSLERTLVTASGEASGDLTGAHSDAAAVHREIDRLAEGARAAIRGIEDPRRIVSALNRFLFEEERFTYDCAAGNPENYLLDPVLTRRRGNCLGLTSLYLILAERLSLPIHGVHVPSHCFARYDDGAVRFNIETGEKGADRSDARYRREYGLAEGRPYLASLSKREMAGVYLKSLGAAYSRKGSEERALHLYRDSALFYPALPDAPFNAGVSRLKLGRFAEAAELFRRAILLDPGMAIAQDNFGVALARLGRFPEALAEARKAVALSPRSAVTRGNLAATLCACGRVEEGMREYRKVLEIDPGNTRALSALAERRRTFSEDPLP